MTEFWSLVKEQNVKTIVSLADVSMKSSKVSSNQELSCVDKDNIRKKYIYIPGFAGFKLIGNGFHYKLLAKTTFV